MLTTLGIVQARESNPLKGIAARRLGGKSLLEWVVRRVTDCQQLDHVIVLTGAEEERLGDLVPPDVPVFASGGRDPLAAVVAALDEYPASSVVRVYADTPFIDPVLIDRLVITAADRAACDYISYCSQDGRPAILSSVGIFAEWCRAEALRQAEAEAGDPLDRQQVTRFIYSHPEKFALRLIPVPAGLDRGEVRLAIDSEEDWEHAQTVFEALGPEALDWQRIAALLEQHPGVRDSWEALGRAARS